ncbi:bifunctional diguanylate cyclase/phosphodiesterase [Pseudoalteromonas sp. MMG007]|uniref:bifunctional diguanylate cyclase/phosphodiesterase n=1 Tax=Pseudoalteromonas sp. MMG007 TaxID=2822684 RepID=UPI001B369A0A|nr:bifunctional diguanylate cyclase/phosphodiesterase [Pseudoalteromonas sp. MMG007]MBQ4859663.1 EAL domain-containing protein [Pseudoalteromonas sp. MMG007]
MESEQNINKLIHQYVINDPLHQLFDAIDVISVQGYDQNRRVIYWNKGSEQLYGFTEEEAKGKRLEDLIIPAPMREVVINAHSNWVNDGIEIPASEITLQCKNGTSVSVFSSHVMFTNQYNTKQMYCIDIDLSDVKKAQADASFNEHMLKTIFGAIPDLFFLMENDGTILQYHASNETDLYTEPKQFIGKKMGDVLPADVAKKFETYISLVLEKEEMMNFKYELSMPHGDVFFEARINKIAKHNQLIVIIRDITEQHKSDELIRHQAYYDSLTLLPNRFLSLDRLSQLLIEAQRNNEKAAVLFLDLDDFKKINDSLGHETGDKLLIDSAQRLQHELRKEDTVGRLGGDEFIILLRDIKDHHSALRITEKLLNNFRTPFKIENRELVLTTSIGVAIYPENGTTVSDLLRNADTAMYQAKSYGRNTYSFFTKKMNAIIQRRLLIEDQMRSALERHEFELYYQPQFDVKSEAIVGAEALLRWHNPILGNVTPDEFIPIAENTGLIVPIGKFVMNQAVHFLNTWQCSSKCKHKYTMAVNLSPRQFRDVGLLSFIQNLLSETNIDPERLELEITEGVLMSCHTNVVDLLTEIAALGINLSMDDFGTGYSSLSYLREYPFNVLKIDRSFIDGIILNSEDSNLVRAIVAMSHSLGLKVVAEGVETQEQHNLLKELDCDFMQGFYFSKPIPAAELLKYSSEYLK